MKFDAHPLVVAVALGLLGPAVLESEDEQDSEHVTTSSKDTSRVTEYQAGPAPDPDEFRTTGPSGPEFHQVEIRTTGPAGPEDEWLKQG